MRELGRAHGEALSRLAQATDERPVVAERDTKSVSVEDTFERDLTDPVLLAGVVERMAVRVAERLSSARLSGRTVTLKIRRHDFATSTRSATLAGPTDDSRVVARVARGLLAELDVSDGIRLLGVAVSGLVDWIQGALFDDSTDDTQADPGQGPPFAVRADQRRRWLPGQDVQHAEHGPGWVWGSGLGRVTVRFETQDTPPGPVRTFGVDEGDLEPRPAPDPTAPDPTTSSEN